MEFEFLVDGAPCRVSLESRGRTAIFKEREAVLEADVQRVSANEILFRLGGRTARVFLVADGDRTLISVAGRGFVITEFRPETAAELRGDERTAEGNVRITAPMPGKVIKLCVGEGDEVKKNRALVIVEAMKMENEIQSPAEGVVRRIHVTVGEFVDSEKPLMEIETVHSNAARRAAP
jgi:acetyl/propionyl-CoA carboxylase alpha subunit